jgi:predicted ester cyclase
MPSLRNSVFLGACILVATFNVQAGQPLTLQSATEVVAPFYDALNQPATKDVAALLDKALSPDWTSCAREQVCMSNRERVIQGFKARGIAIPDLKWDIKEVLVSGDQAIVRAEASGTPVSPILGLVPNGKSFDITAIDIHTIQNGKIIRTYHVEDWAGAAQEMRAK